MKPTFRLLSAGLLFLLLATLIVAYAPSASAQEPPPKPTPEAGGRDGPGDQVDCSVSSLGSISSSVTRTGSWSSSCSSANRSGRYARFYSFSVSGTSDVQIDLSSSVDTYLFLLSGAGTSGSIEDRDDDGGTGSNSRIEMELSAGSYTVEATTFYSARTGSFTLTIDVSGSTTGPSNAPAPTGLRVTSSTDTRVSLRWNSVTNAYRYKLERSAGSSGPWTVVSQHISGTTSAAYSLDCTRATISG